MHYLESPASSYVKLAVQAVQDIHREGLPGDILIFLTGAPPSSPPPSPLHPLKPSKPSHSLLTGMALMSMTIRHKAGGLPADQEDVLDVICMLKASSMHEHPGAQLTGHAISWPRGGFGLIMLHLGTCAACRPPGKTR